jgi:hypothetical protein
LRNPQDISAGQANLSALAAGGAVLGTCKA